MSISIPLETFRSVFNRDDLVISQEMIDKTFAVKQLMNNEIVYSPPINERQYTKHISAFNCHFTTEDKKKKIITSLLNKLSPKNVDVISKKIENEISEPYDQDINTIISFVRRDRSNIDIYVTILKLFPNDIVCDIIANMCDLKSEYWIIKEEYIDQNVYSSTCEYDLYCSFIKWKDSQLAITELSTLFLSFETNEELAKVVYNNINKYINTCKEQSLKPSRDNLDPSLEHLEILHQYLLNLDINLDSLMELVEIPSSSRFKINDIKNKLFS